MRTIGLLGVLLTVGCAHAKQVEAPAEAMPQPAPAPAKPRPAPPPVEQTHPASPPPPGHPALSASPAGTFQPGAIREIQKALRDRGFGAPESGHLDDATQRQIARYQKTQSMPDTGFPDDATVVKLGLDPAKLHRANP